MSYGFSAGKKKIVCVTRDFYYLSTVLTKQLPIRVSTVTLIQVLVELITYSFFRCRLEINIRLRDKVRSQLKREYEASLLPPTWQ